VRGDQAVSSREFAVNCGQRTEQSNLRLQAKPIDSHWDAVQDTRELQAGGSQEWDPELHRMDKTEARTTHPEVGADLTPAAGPGREG
jgi:hypothetical protein